MRASTIFKSALVCTVVSAWPEFMMEPGELIERGMQLLEPRQQTSSKSFDLSFSATQGQVTTTAASTKSASVVASTITTGSNSGSVVTATNTNTNKATTTSYSQTVFDPRAGVGGISMATPNPFSGATYYKIKDYVTFGWNYTSCSILPTAIDILAVASNTNVQRTFTLALNQTVTASSQAFTWDTGDYQATATDPLLTASYTLIVHDANIDVSATPSPGYLGIANNFAFAMYVPQASVAFDGFRCVTCSAAVSSIEKQTLSVVFGMMAVTILSFTWFTGAVGLI